MVKCLSSLVSPVAALAVVLLSTSAAGAAESRFGVLLMAHGGSPEWNQTVLDTVEPLTEEYPVEVAFGMADSVSLQAGINNLEQQGVTDIGVVRMFVSGNSWYERTLQILGLLEGAPTRAEQHAAHAATETAAHGADAIHRPAAAGRHSMEFWQIDSHAEFAVSKEGLADAMEVEGILLDRASALSTNPANENLIIIAHGTQNDAEDAAWVDYISSRTRLVRRDMAFNHVQVYTLREDWRQKRDVAEQQIRDYVSRSNETGKEVIVLPFRVQGFGPYEEVLEGLPYRADKLGLTPHDNIRDWIERQAEDLQRMLQS